MGAPVVAARTLLLPLVAGAKQKVIKFPVRPLRRNKFDTAARLRPLLYNVPTPSAILAATAVLLAQQASRPAQLVVASRPVTASRLSRPLPRVAVVKGQRLVALSMLSRAAVSSSNRPPRLNIPSRLILPSEEAVAARARLTKRVTQDAPSDLIAPLMAAMKSQELIVGGRPGASLRAAVFPVRSDAVAVQGDRPAVRQLMDGDPDNVASSPLAVVLKDIGDAVRHTAAGAVLAPLAYVKLIADDSLVAGVVTDILDNAGILGRSEEVPARLAAFPALVASLAVLARPVARRASKEVVLFAARSLGYVAHRRYNPSYLKMDNRSPRFPLTKHNFWRRCV